MTGPASTAAISRAGMAMVTRRLGALGFTASPIGRTLLAIQTTGGEVRVLVRTNAAPKPGGGKGAPSLDWWFPEEHPADFVATIDLSTEGVWLFRANEAAALAQQHPKGRHHLYMYVQPVNTRRTRVHNHEFEDYLLERRPDLLGVPA